MYILQYCSTVYSTNYVVLWIQVNLHGDPDPKGTITLPNQILILNQLIRANKTFQIIKFSKLWVKPNPLRYYDFFMIFLDVNCLSLPMVGSGSTVQCTV